MGSTGLVSISSSFFSDSRFSEIPNVMDSEAKVRLLDLKSISTSVSVSVEGPFCCRVLVSSTVERGTVGKFRRYISDTIPSQVGPSIRVPAE